MRYSKIIGTGSYLPEKTFTNADWERLVQTSDEWIFDRTGIKSRHIADKSETASSMGTIAAKRALQSCGLLAKDIDMIIVATGLPDKVFPATACLVQKNLKIPSCIAFDLQAACTGFIYGLSVADQFIKTGVIKNALVIGSELMSRLIDWSDRNTCVLFGDGAGAVVLSAANEPGILSTHLYAQGEYDELLWVDNMQTGDHTKVIENIASTENNNLPLDELNPFVNMQGKKVFKIAVSMLGKMVEDIQKKYDLDKQEIDWLVPHQANIRIIKAVADKLNLSMDKVICTVDTHSNTSSASIPLALDVAVRDGRIKAGQTLLFEAFGAGLTWGSALVKY